MTLVPGISCIENVAREKKRQANQDWATLEVGGLLMRYGISVIAALVGTGIAMAQTGGTHGSMGGSIGSGHLSGGTGQAMSGASGLRAGSPSGAASGVRPGSGIHPGGPLPRLSPSMSPRRFNSTADLGSRQYAGSQQDRPGNWTSSGFIPNPNGQPQYAGDRQKHVGYGYGIGFPTFGYGLGYYGSGLGDYDPNDPNSQARPQDAPAVMQQQAGPSYEQQQYPGGYGPQDAAATGWSDPGNGARAAYRRSDVESAENDAQQAPRSDGLTHPKVTLIFKDGRKPLQMQNYAMTQTKIYVRDQGSEQDVAISDVDVVATMAANGHAGVDFALPVRN